MKTVNSKKRRGTALLESIIAIGVILVGVVGALVLLNTSINLGRANQDRIVGQNLAREGLELAYSLRNSGAMRSVDQPKVSWLSFIHDEVLKTNNPEEYLTKYNLGDVVSGVCMQRCITDNPANHCTTEGNDQIDDAGVLRSDDPDDDDVQERLCDLDALDNYVTRVWTNPPQACMDATKNDGVFIISGHSMSASPSNCNYNGQGGIDISDISLLLDIFYQQSYQFGFGYPTLASGVGDTQGKLSFYNPISDPNGNNFVSATGQYIDIESAWDDSRARLFTDSAESTYVQNVSLPGNIATKFYRLVSVQTICRGVNDGTETDIVTNAISAYNCIDYAKTLAGWTEDEAKTMQTVGALITSEVRWPTPTSSTKVRYQEYLYDWLTL